MRASRLFSRWSSVRPLRFQRIPFRRDVALDPGGATAPRITVPHMLPSTLMTGSASATLSISRLNPTPQQIAVYASQSPSPTPTQHLLPGGPLRPYPCRSSTSWNAPASPDAHGGREPSYPGPTGWAEAVARLRLPQNVACRFPALRSSGVDSQHYESLQRPVGQPQSWSEQRDPLLEPIEGGPGKVAACPTAAAEHLAPVTLDEPVHPVQRADVAGDAIISVVPTEGEIECVDLFLDRQ